MDLLPPEVRQYVAAHTEPEPPLLAALDRATHLRTMYPRMASGHYQGRLLALMSRLLRPQHVLEVGTFTGYATLCLAEGLPPQGRILTLERDPELAAMARTWFAQAGETRIDLQVGDALAALEALPPTPQFDFVFLDADKPRYLAYYEAILPRLRPNGLLCTDNVLWSGHVVYKTEPDAATAALRAFNSFVSRDARVEKVLLPVRDGLYLIRKRGPDELPPAP